jgi:hypothetical protein
MGPEDNKLIIERLLLLLLLLSISPTCLNPKPHCAAALDLYFQDDVDHPRVRGIYSDRIDEKIDTF